MPELLDDEYIVTVKMDTGPFGIDAAHRNVVKTDGWRPKEEASDDQPADKPADESPEKKK